MSKKKRDKRKRRSKAEPCDGIFDIFSLLESENTETKPNMSKFLKERVSRIGGNPFVKPEFYPVPELKINKYFVRFLDDHELILDLDRTDRIHIYYSLGLEEIDMTAHELKLAMLFFRRLSELGFIQKTDHMGHNIADRIQNSAAGSISTKSAENEIE